MRIPFAGFVVAAWFAAAASGQNPTGEGVERVLTLTQTYSPQALQEMANVIRSVVSIREVVPDAQRGTLTLRATADQFSLSEWLVNQLDQPATGPSPHEYRLPGGGNEVAQVFYTHTTSSQDLQEMVNVLRSIATVSFTMPFFARQAIALRGTEDKTALAGWLVSQLDQPANPADKHEYRVPSTNDVARVFFLTNAKVPQDLQSVINTVRAKTRINRLMPYNAQSAMVLRATDSQVAEAEQLVQQLDVPTAQPATR